MQVKYLAQGVQRQCPVGESNVRPLDDETNSFAIILRCRLIMGLRAFAARLAVGSPRPVSWV
uniref:Uncharacterized protein n=1 Tax=Anguilla anguilla TaxID=7936 RepID=A0A0E9UPQ9_ANGAN